MLVNTSECVFGERSVASSGRMYGVDRTVFRSCSVVVDFFAVDVADVDSDRDAISVCFDVDVGFVVVAVVVADAGDGSVTW